MVALLLKSALSKFTDPLESWPFSPSNRSNVGILSSYSELAP